MKVEKLIEELNEYYPYEEVGIDVDNKYTRVKGIGKYYYDGFYRLVIECE